MTTQRMESTAEDAQLIELDSRRRTTVRTGHHSRYLVTEEDDGTLIWRPAVVLTEDELALRDAPWLVNQIDEFQRNPSKGVRRKLPPRKD